MLRRRSTGCWRATTPVGCICAMPKPGVTSRGSTAPSYRRAQEKGPRGFPRGPRGKAVRCRTACQVSRLTRTAPPASPSPASRHRDSPRSGRSC
jgi:hypothetical protein